ncbi:MAG TPA: hypothetical protein VN700_12380 [Vicinamibacterales bacterium]|nr:hypothetical protein [Vicinamibacterales bacterium]
MAGHLAIAKIALSKRHRSLPDPMDGHRDIWFDVTIDVENRGDVPLYVIDELRGIAFDAATRVLSLRLCESQPQPVQQDAPTFHLPPPHTLTVDRRATASIVVKIPLVLKELRLGAGGVLSMEQTDMSTMKTIRCEVASSDRPIEDRGAETAHELRSRLGTWGKVVSKDAAVDPDLRDSQAGQTPDGPDPKKLKKR